MKFKQPTISSITTEQSSEMISVSYLEGVDFDLAYEVSNEEGGCNFLLTTTGLICMKSDERDAISFMKLLFTIANEK